MGSSRKWRGPWVTQDVRPTRGQLRWARIYSLAQLPIGALALYWLWTSYWSADSAFATVSAVAFTAFTLLIVTTNIREAWFRKHPEPESGGTSHGRSGRT